MSLVQIQEQDSYTGDSFGSRPIVFSLELIQEDALMKPEGFGNATCALSVVNGVGKFKTFGVGAASIAFTTYNELPVTITNGIGSANIFLRINDEANNFFVLSAEGIGEASLGVVNSYIDFSCLAHGYADATVNWTRQSNPEVDVIHFILDLLPATNTSRYRQYSARVKRNGTVLPISSFSLTKSSVSSNFQFRLARLSDRNLLVPSDSYKLEISETIADTTAWRTIFDTAKLASRSYSVGMAESSPTDTVSITASSDLSNKLSKAPLANTVYYDPFRTTVESEAIENLYDTSGRVYQSQVLPINLLSLATLLNEVFVGRCGFTQIISNLPDFPIKRADFPASASYYQSIRGVIGMFDLSITASDDGTILYIRDISAGIPSGFPLPRSLTTTQYKSFNRTEEFSSVHGIRLNYVANETERTFKVQRLVQTTKDLGNGIEERTENSVFDFYSFTHPTTLIKTLPDISTKTLHDGATISESKERFTYDSANRTTHVIRTLKSLLPSQAADGTIDESQSWFLQTYQTEDTYIYYAMHPFVPRAVYQQRVVTRVRGLLATDTDNPYLANSFTQPFFEAHTAGNLRSGMLISDEPIETIIETFEPLRSGEVKSEVKVIRHYRVNLATTEQSGNRSGDASLSQAGQSNQSLLIFESDGHSISGEAIQDLHIGEMPLYLGITLARNTLIRLKNYLGQVTADLLGLDLNIIDGSSVTLISRNAEAQGAVIVRSVSISGTSLGTESQEITQQIQGDRISV